MKIAIVGSRNSYNLTAQDIINNIPEKTSTIISGGAVGVDSLVKDVSKIMNIPIIEIVPNYTKYGKRGPLIRNTKIVETADEVVAFWDYKSNGTRNVILTCLKLQKPVKIIIIQSEQSNRQFI